MPLRHTLLICAIAAFALAGSPVRAADSDPLLDTAERHVRLQTQGLPGKVDIQMGKPDTTRLPPCSAVEAFTPPGGRMMGKTYVGIRCLAPNAWSILVPVQISVTGSYVLTTRSLLAGQTVQAGDVIDRQGDLSTLPTGLISDPQQAVGKTLRVSLGAGQPLRSDVLLSPLVIRQNQTVRILSRGSGFSISAEGRALNNASEGQIVNLRMPSGQTVSGTARADGSVEISF